MEVELKLLIAPADVSAFRRHPALQRCALGPPRTQRLLSQYHDTPDRRLHRAGLVWRVRRVGRGWVQTVKADGDAVAGLHRRPEWESALAAARPDLDALVASAGAAALPPLLAEVAPGLLPLFGTAFRRTTWRLRLDRGTEVELALDQGQLVAGDRRRAISEIELELKSGDAAALFDFALELVPGLALRVAHQSKAERGFALQAHARHPAVKATPPALTPALTLEAAFTAIVHGCLAQMQANEPGVIEGGDADGLHQLRVGLRRLRTALRLFRPWIAAPAPLADGLRQLSTALGEARDAEVLGGETLVPVLAGAPADAALRRLQRAVATGATGLHHQAAAMLAAPEHTRLMLSLGAWLLGRRWRETLDDGGLAAIDAPVDAAAQRMLARCRKRLRASDPGPAPVPPEQRHAVRIAAKRLRYAIEFFAALQPPARVRRALARLAALQDLLGRLNDIAVADAALQRLAQRRPALAQAAGYARGWLQADSRPAEERWPALLSRCLRMRAPWR